jgi:dihydropteroate synthase
MMMNRKRDIEQQDSVQILGIINITPDSFYDGGKYPDVESVIRDIQNKIDAGADWIDIGACSTRPMANSVSVNEECERLKILEDIRGAFPDIKISLDTYRAEVAKFAVEAYNINMINDISGLEDPEMAAFITAYQMPYVLTFSEGHINIPLKTDTKSDVLIPKMLDFFKSHLDLLPHDLTLLDLGFGFNKSLHDNYTLLKHLDAALIFNRPILAGISRKRMVYEPLNTYPTSALNGTTALNAIALWKGARWLRVHDVREAYEVAQLIHKLQNA